MALPSARELRFAQDGESDNATLEYPELIAKLRSCVWRRGGGDGLRDVWSEFGLGAQIAFRMPSKSTRIIHKGELLAQAISFNHVFLHISPKTSYKAII